MDSKGYKIYLQSLGNQQHYIGQIPELIKLERDLGIDLDEYIPWDEDYSKVEALDAILPCQLRENIKLSFSINSYMRYKLSGYKKPEIEVDDMNSVGDFFSFRGTKEELRTSLLSFMSEEDSRAFIDGFEDCLRILEETDCVTKTRIPSPNDANKTPGTMQLLIESWDYNINIKALTLTALSVLLDIKLTLGVVNGALAILGFNNQAIAKIDATEGEKCLILEAIHSKRHIIDEDVFNVCNCECVHNNLVCKYRDGEKCTITKKQIREILDGLCEKNIFKKVNRAYRYNF